MDEENILAPLFKFAQDFTTTDVEINHSFGLVVLRNPVLKVYNLEQKEILIDPSIASLKLNYPQITGFVNGEETIIEYNKEKREIKRTND